MNLPINQIIAGDCLEVMKGWPDGCIHTIITDPPYGLSFMGKKWDYAVPAVEVWQEALRVLKPGGTMLCFAGSRTQHRMACNVEDAGFILKDCIMWLYGSGFPKATDISKQLDKGQERAVVGISSGPNNSQYKGDRYTEKRATKFGVVQDQPETTLPTTPEAQLWNGWKSHGLKPAYEPILVAMKPNDGTYANNALVHGVSGLNIDGGRIGTGDSISGSGKGFRSDKGFGQIGRGKMTNSNEGQHSQGRFPANVILDEEAGAMLDEQSGALQKSKGNYVRKNGASQFLDQMGNGTVDRPNGICDAGGASRFFYCAKASKAERNAGCEGLEERNLAGGNKWTDVDYRKGDGEVTAKPQKNHHPTVKPLALMEYLCTLTKTPTGGTVLDPYCGSGTTCVAAQNTGRDFIGIEISEEYCQIARERLEAVETGVPIKET